MVSQISSSSSYLEILLGLGTVVNIINLIFLRIFILYMLLVPFIRNRNYDIERKKYMNHLIKQIQHRYICTCMIYTKTMFGQFIDDQLATILSIYNCMGICDHPIQVYLCDPNTDKCFRFITSRPQYIVVHLKLGWACYAIYLQLLDETKTFSIQFLYFLV